MILIIILIVIALLFSFILMARLLVSINTETGLYKFNFGRIISLQLERTGYRFFLKVKVLFLRFNIRLKKTSTHKESSSPRIKAGISKRLERIPRARRFLKAAYASIHLKRFYADIDTGDYPLNAQLIPVAQWINRGNIDLRINFEGENQLDCLIQTRLIIIAWNYITKGK